MGVEFYRAKHCVKCNKENGRYQTDMATVSHTELTADEALKGINAF